MSTSRFAASIAVSLLFLTGIASAQYGYTPQGPPPGAGRNTPPPTYSPSNPSFDPNMGMAPTSYGGPSYTGQPGGYQPQQATAPAPATIGNSMLTYGQLEVDYLRTSHENKQLKASDGVGISLNTLLFNPFYLHFGVDFSSGTDATFSAKNYDFSTITLGAGGYFAVSDRFHLTGEIGFLYADLNATRSNLSFTNGAIYMKPGVRFAATDSLELDGHISATSADKYDSFVFDVGGYYKVFAQMDLGLNIGFGDQTTAYRAGVRFRW